MESSWPRNIFAYSSSSNKVIASNFYKEVSILKCTKQGTVASPGTFFLLVQLRENGNRMDHRECESVPNNEPANAWGNTLKCVTWVPMIV